MLTTSVGNTQAPQQPPASFLDEYGIILAAAGGGLILLIVIAVVVCVCLAKRKKAKTYAELDQNDADAVVVSTR
jgi:hypothetical protein